MRLKSSFLPLNADTKDKSLGRDLLLVVGHYGKEDAGQDGLFVFLLVALGIRG